MTIADARAHPLLQSNLAIRDLGVVAYAGVPVYGQEGQALGSLCAIDAKPRTWSEDDIATLQDLSTLAEAGTAQSELARQKPGRPADYDRYVEAAGAAIGGAARILRRNYAVLKPAERDTLLDIIEEYGRHLVQLNRMIQVAGALH